MLGVVVGAGLVVAAGVALGAGVVVAAGAVEEGAAVAAQAHEHVTHKHRALLRLQGQHMLAVEDWHSLLLREQLRPPVPPGALSWSVTLSPRTLYRHSPGCLWRGGAR